MGAKLLSAVGQGSPGLGLRAGRTVDRGRKLYEEVQPRRAAPTALRLVSGGRAAKTAPDGVVRPVAEVDRLKADKRNQTRLLAIICHELRHPLTRIQACADLFAESPDFVPRAAEMIRRAAKQQERLISDLLDLAEAEEGALRLQRAPVDLVALVRAFASEAKSLQAPEIDTRIVLQTPARPVRGYWDAGRLTQVLQNLVANAVAYAPPGSEVTIRVEDLGTEARVSITDQGTGIPAKELPDLFEPFFRGEAGRQNRRGLGLGLHVSKVVIDAHGGDIGATSPGAGKGSTFYFTLPTISGVGA
jgi:two-component system CheB/CheR fusion protein